MGSSGESEKGEVDRATKLSRLGVRSPPSTQHLTDLTPTVQ